MIFSIDLVLYETLQFTCTNFDGCHTEEDNFFNLLQKEGGTHPPPPTPPPPKKKKKKGGGGGGFIPGGIMLGKIVTWNSYVF